MDCAECVRARWVPRRGGARADRACCNVGRSLSVLARALDAFPGPKALRTLDALHLASCAYLTEHGQVVALASYDRRINALAGAMGIRRFDLESPKKG